MYRLRPLHYTGALPDVRLDRKPGTFDCVESPVLEHVYSFVWGDSHALRIEDSFFCCWRALVGP